MRRGYCDVRAESTGVEIRSLWKIREPYLEERVRSDSCLGERAAFSVASLGVAVSQAFKVLFCTVTHTSAPGSQVFHSWPKETATLQSAGSFVPPVIWCLVEFSNHDPPWDPPGTARVAGAWWWARPVPCAVRLRHRSQETCCLPVWNTVL